MRKLSPRENQILGMISYGLTSYEIAQRLEISPATIRTHRQNILTKTHATNMAHAVAMWFRGEID